MYHASIRHPAHNNMFTTSNVAEHDKIKAKLLGPYSGRETKAMEPMYAEPSSKFPSWTASSGAACKVIHRNFGP